jgi:hypothetical protein
MVCPASGQPWCRSWIISSIAPTPSDVIIEKLSKPSVKQVEAVNEAIDKDLMVINKSEQEPVYDWMNPIKMFLETRPPSDRRS